MTDRELLDRCAKVMGYTHWSDLYHAYFTGNDLGKELLWNPLTNLADAADMAIKMKVDVYWQELLGCVQCNYSPAHGDTFISARAFFKDHPTEQAAYCYAVCSVVAQMGETK